MTRDGCNFDLPRNNELQEHPLADVFGAEGNPYGMASLGKNSRESWPFNKPRLRNTVGEAGGGNNITVIYSNLQ